jgi:hypothetical protein
VGKLTLEVTYDLQPYAKSLDDKIYPPLKDIVMAAVNLDSVFTSKLYFKEERWYGFLPVHLNKELYILIRAEVASVIVEMSPEMSKKASMLNIFFATLKASQRDRFGRPRNGPPST